MLNGCLNWLTKCKMGTLVHNNHITDGHFLGSIFIVYQNSKTPIGYDVCIKLPNFKSTYCVYIPV